MGLDTKPTDAASSDANKASQDTVNATKAEIADMNNKMMAFQAFMNTQNTTREMHTAAFNAINRAAEEIQSR